MFDNMNDNSSYLTRLLPEIMHEKHLGEHLVHRQDTMNVTNNNKVGWDAALW
jgi:hypothetical protein